MLGADLERALQRMLQPLWSALSTIAVRGVVRLIESGDGVQLMQVQVRRDVTLENIPFAENYGTSSVPLNDSEVILLSIGGDRSHAVALVVGGSKHRPKDLQGGDSCLYDHEGQRVWLSRDGIVIEAPKGLKIIGDTEIDGALTVSGESTATDHLSGGISGKDHIHIDSNPGNTTKPQ